VPDEATPDQQASAALSVPGERLLAQQGLADASREALGADASARRYVRLPGRGCLLMEDVTDPASVASFLRIAGHLQGLGLSAPTTLAADPEAGVALIEDFGDATYARVLRHGGSEADLYALAVDALSHLHTHPHAAAIDLPAYTARKAAEDVALFSTSFLAEILAPPALAACEAEVAPLWRRALSAIDAAPATLMLRDFHIDNLMLLSSREGPARCGLLDFQDAFLGPPEYDLMSLLQDARRDLAPGLEAAMIDRYLAATGAPAADMLARFHLLAAQRHARIAGVFVRLWRQGGKPGYLRFLPRVLGQFEAALDAAGLTEIAACLGRHGPDWRARGAALARHAA